MPSKSKAQERLFAAAAHSPEFAKKAGIKSDTAKEWHDADKAQSKNTRDKKPETVATKESRSIYARW